MSEDPRTRAEELARIRAEARAAKDFARADALRQQIGELGFDVLDEPAGWRLEPRRWIPTVSVQVLYEGFRDDLERFLEGFETAIDHEIVVIDNGGGESWLDGIDAIRVLRLPAEVGWAEARNTGMGSADPPVVLLADLSVEPSGDIVSPLLEALQDPSIGIAGGWGLVTDDMREFRSAPGPDVHAVEGYLLAMRGETARKAAFDPWFTWYRHADLDLSFRVRALGLRAVAVEVPAERRTHRGWEAVPEPERSKRSKRNFYRFLDHWVDRADLVAPRQ